MRTYLMIWNSTAAGLAWEVKFDQPSDLMALDYAGRQVKRLEAKDFISMQLWEVQNFGESQRFLGTISREDEPRTVAKLSPNFEGPLRNGELTV